jgi:putative PIN family toxin of toxin-antitoxin system
LAEAGKIRLAVSDDILNEVKRVLLRPKFGWSQDRVDAAIRQIAGFAEHVEPQQRIEIVVDDPTDNRILECAFASGSDYLVSGDNHLLKVRQSGLQDRAAGGVPRDSVATGARTLAAAQSIVVTALL